MPSSRINNTGTPEGNVALADSIVNRLVNMLDYLRSAGPQSASIPAPEYWQQFFLLDSHSPYVTPHFGPMYPDWSKIIIAGHSQGAAHASFIAKFLPTGQSFPRVVLFSGPQEHLTTPDAPPAWVQTPSNSTPLARFYGLRSIGEESNTVPAAYGGFVTFNWANMGGPLQAGTLGDFTGGLRGAEPSPAIDPATITGSSPLFGGSHRLVINANYSAHPSDDTALHRHTSTAGDCLSGDQVCPIVANQIQPIWNYMFTGAYAD
jgi:hypothetical protein